MENEENKTPLTWSRAVLGLSTKPMTATEIRERKRDVYFRLRQEMLTKPNPAWVDEFVNETQRRVADAMGLAPAAVDPGVLCGSHLMLARRVMERWSLSCKRLSITLPAKDFDAISREIGLFSEYKFTFAEMEILRGESQIIIWLDLPDSMVKTCGEPLKAEILGCLQGGRVTELPQSASSNGVSPRAKPVSEVGIAPSPASGDDRDSNGLAHLSDEAKVIAAKEAIAAYARKKQLPSPAHLALFGELDGKRAGNKRPRYSISPAEAARLLRGDFIDDIHRNDHGLASEPLGRAIDQIWVRENGGSYADLISSRSERLAEMVNRGDSAADGERG